MVTYQYIVETFGEERLYRHFLDWKLGSSIEVPADLKKIDPQATWQDLYFRFAGDGFVRWMLIEIWSKVQ